MPKFTTKIYYSKDSDLRVLQNIAIMVTQERTVDKAVTAFINKAVQEYANGVLQHLKTVNSEKLNQVTEGAAPAGASDSNGGVSVPASPAVLEGASPDSQQGDADSAALADEEEAAAEATPGP